MPARAKLKVGKPFDISTMQLGPGRPRVDVAGGPLTNTERQTRWRNKGKIERMKATPEGRKHLSELVVEKVTVAVRTGELQPTIRDGLNAEKIIEARIQKTDDRKTALAVAMILSGASGGGVPEALLIDDGMTIDGDAEEVDD